MQFVFTDGSASNWASTIEFLYLAASVLSRLSGSSAPGTSSVSPSAENSSGVSESENVSDSSCALNVSVSSATSGVSSDTSELSAASETSAASSCSDSSVIFSIPDENSAACTPELPSIHRDIIIDNAFTILFFINFFSFSNHKISCDPYFDCLPFYIESQVSLSCFYVLYCAPSGIIFLSFYRLVSTDTDVAVLFGRKLFQSDVLCITLCHNRFCFFHVCRSTVLNLVSTDGFHRLPGYFCLTLSD